MLKTEDEARQCWCPFVRHASTTDDCAAINRGGNEMVPNYARCIASKCMAWRWDKTECLAFPDDEIDEPRGYCGLAGKPESDE